MIPEILDFFANSVPVGSRPANGKREWTFLVLVGGAAIALLIFIVAITT